MVGLIFPSTLLTKVFVRRESKNAARCNCPSVSFVDRPGQRQSKAAIALTPHIILYADGSCCLPKTPSSPPTFLQFVSSLNMKHSFLVLSIIISAASSTLPCSRASAQDVSKYYGHDAKADDARASGKASARIDASNDARGAFQLCLQRRKSCASSRHSRNTIS